MQREPLGDVWETLDNPDRAELVSGFNEAERVHPPHRRLALLEPGVLAARRGGRAPRRPRPWAESLRARILDPLEMRRTTVGFDGRHAQGYYVPPFSDVPSRSRCMDLRAMDPCGGLASTGADLARWSAFVADPVAEVLVPRHRRGDVPAADRHGPRALDRARWASASSWSAPAPARTSATPAACPATSPRCSPTAAAKTGGVALTNSGTTADITGFALALADHVTEHDPVEPEPWRPGTASRRSSPASSDVWYSEGIRRSTSRSAGGRLEARAASLPEHKPPSRSSSRSGPTSTAPSPAARHGELLRVTRDAERHGSAR